MLSLDSTTLKYDWTPGTYARQNQNLLEECSALYSKHYGTWSARSDLSGRVRLSARRLRRWFDSENSRIYWARLGSKLVGYATSVHMKTYLGIVSWVTQFVVHEDYRNQGIGTNLLFAVWRLEDHFAWGLLTANPYAVRALEKATQRRCEPDRIKKNKRVLLKHGWTHVPYVDEHMNVDVGNGRSRIHTEFFVDHSDVNDMLQRVTESLSWKLGEIREGWEWFAFTFKDQCRIPLSLEDVTSMLVVSDQITHQAYARMQLNDGHAWARHACRESSQIIDYCQIEKGQTVLDFGCGPGRHAIELAKFGVVVTGVDYNGVFVRKAGA